MRNHLINIFCFVICASTAAFFTHFFDEKNALAHWEGSNIVVNACVNDRLGQSIGVGNGQFQALGFECESGRIDGKIIVK